MMQVGYECQGADPVTTDCTSALGRSGEVRYAFTLSVPVHGQPATATHTSQQEADLLSVSQPSRLVQPTDVGIAPTVCPYTSATMAPEQRSRVLNSRWCLSTQRPLLEFVNMIGVNDNTVF